MKKVLAARVVVFGLSVVWVLGWLLTCLVIFPFFGELLRAVLPYPSLVGFAQFWFIFTAVVIGVWIAIKGFRFVGRWVKNDES